MRRRVAPVVLVALSLVAGACREEPGEDWQRLEAMEQEIRALVEAGECTADGDCTMIALGAKPCGGPWGYLVYSPATVDTVQLRALADAYTTFNVELNARHGTASDCALQPVPEPVCRDGRCVDALGLYDEGIPPGPGAP